jgi:hypothetical protein
MLEEPKALRENVVYVSRDGNIYANRASLKAGTHIRRRIPGMNAVADESGKIYPVPPFLPKPTVFPHPTGQSKSRIVSMSQAVPLQQERRLQYADPPPTTSTGPYYRIYSDPGTYTAGLMYAIVPCNATSSSSQGPYGTPATYMAAAGVETAVTPQMLAFSTVPPGPS